MERVLRWLSVLSVVVLTGTTTGCSDPVAGPASVAEASGAKPQFGYWACVTTVGVEMCTWYPDTCAEDPNSPDCASNPEVPAAPCDPYYDPTCGGPSGTGDGGGGSTGGGGPTGPSQQEMITRCDPPGSATSSLNTVDPNGSVGQQIIAKANLFIQKGGYCAISGAAMRDMVLQRRLSLTTNWFNALNGSGGGAAGRTYAPGGATIISTVNKPYPATAPVTYRAQSEFVVIAFHEAGHQVGWTDTEISARNAGCF
jgi:hypothetical protein